MTRAGFVQMRRELLEHLPGLTGTEAKVLFALLCLAYQKTRTVDASLTTIGAAVGVSDPQVSRALTSLHRRGLIAYAPAANQHARTKVTITAWQQLVAGSAAAPDATAPARVDARASSEHSPSDASSQAPDLPEPAPYTSVEVCTGSPSPRHTQTGARRRARGIGDLADEAAEGLQRLRTGVSNG